nr:hypothetical protein [uncultured Prevotella sp.]
MPSKKITDYKSIPSLFLLESMLDYLDFADYADMVLYYIFCLEEKSLIPDDLSHLLLVSKGF